MYLKKIFLLVFLVGINFLSTSPLAFANANKIGYESTNESAVSNVVDVNTATLEQLMSLKGIGTKRAEAILEDRKVNGKFNTLEDLARVKGFSKKIIARIIAENEGRIKLG